MKKNSQSTPRATLLPVLVFFIYRLLISFTIRTSESPDEWWQGEEVAYYIVYGRGHLSWEWKEGIRSVVFPSIFAIPLFLLKALGLDTPRAVYAALRLVQVLIASGIDCAVFALARRLDDAMDMDERVSRNKKDDGAGHHEASADSKALRRQKGLWLISPLVAKTLFPLMLLEWYYVLEGSRAYTNVAECLPVMIALLQSKYHYFLVCAAFACMIRVTAVIALLPIFVVHMRCYIARNFTGAKVRGGFMMLLLLLLKPVVQGAVAAVVALAITSLIDYSVFYGRWLVTPFNFVKYNIGMNVSRFYGTHPVYWYLIAGFPMIAGPHVVLLLLVPLVLRRMRAGRHTRELVYRLLFVLVWTIACQSLVAHKEMRFLFHMLPIAMILVSFVLSATARYPEVVLGDTSPRLVRLRVVKMVHVVFLMVNVILLGYLGFCYRQGGLGILAEIRNGDMPPLERVDVMTVCYFTPGHGHVHGRVRTLYINDCPMKLDPATQLPLRTVDQLLRENPVGYVLWRYTRDAERTRKGSLRSNSVVRPVPQIEQVWWETAHKLLPEGAPEPLPDGLILFRGVADLLADVFLLPSNYSRAKALFHAYKSLEEGEDSYVELWIRTDKGNPVRSTVT